MSNFFLKFSYGHVFISSGRGTGKVSGGRVSASHRGKGSSPSSKWCSMPRLFRRTIEGERIALIPTHPRGSICIAGEGDFRGTDLGILLKSPQDDPGVGDPRPRGARGKTPRPLSGPIGNVLRGSVGCGVMKLFREHPVHTVARKHPKRLVSTCRTRSDR